MTARTRPAKRSARPQLVITRILDAPPSLVFKAWTEPEHLVHWSCPHGFTLTHCEGDVRPGGAWRSCMRSPEGRDLWLGGAYREIVEPERLVFTHAWEDETGKRGHETVVTVTLAERGGKTEMRFHQAFFESVESRDGHRGGWTECFDRLAAHLKPSTLTLPSDRTIVMERVFDAPRELVFRAYTDRTMIPHWWGPRRLTTTVKQMDVRPGGEWRFVSRAPDGTEHGFHGEYREIVPPERLVSTFEYEGTPGHVVLDTATFQDLGGRTKLTVTSLFRTPEDRDGMLRSGMEEGATESMDRLAELLAAYLARA